MNGNPLGVRVVRSLAILRRNVPRISDWVWRRNLKNPSQISRVVPVGPKLGFKPYKEYTPVPKKPTASPSGNKKKCVVHTNEVSNSNPFYVLNSVDNDVEKFQDLLIDGQAILVDEAGVPLKKVECPSDYDSEDEVASVDNDMARSLASERVGFGTQSLLEQLRVSYGDLIMADTRKERHLGTYNKFRNKEKKKHFWSTTIPLDELDVEFFQEGENDGGHK
ncbi:hypothetical protein Tco_1365421 [Tanacetum coccineum]